MKQFYAFLFLSFLPVVLTGQSDVEVEGNIFFKAGLHSELAIKDQTNPGGNGGNLFIHAGNTTIDPNSAVGGNLILQAGRGQSPGLGAFPGHLFIRSGWAMLGNNLAFPGTIHLQYTNNGTDFNDHMSFHYNRSQIHQGLFLTGFTETSGSGVHEAFKQLIIEYPNKFDYSWHIGQQTDLPTVSDNDLYFYVTRAGTTTLAGWIQDNVAGSQMNFTGQHRSFIKNIDFSDPELDAEDIEGLIVVADQNEYMSMTGGLKIGLEAIAMNEALPIVQLSTKAKDKRVFGVISGIEPEDRNDGYGAFMTNFEKEEGDHRVYINSVGEGAIWVIDSEGNLEGGDYITTSNVRGYGMRQQSEFIANYTVAKITMDCDFNPPMIPKRKIKKVQKVIEEQVIEENVLDENGRITWEQVCDENGKPVFEPAYKIRYLNSAGTLISYKEYLSQKSQGKIVHRAAFVGCTYHSG